VAKALMVIFQQLATLSKAAISTQLIPGVPVFTNPEEQHVASMLVAPQLCQALCAHVEPKVKTLLAIFPAETRILWSPVDTPMMEATLRAIGAKARQDEGDDFLSGEVLRFDGSRWIPTEQSGPCLSTHDPAAG
jgi:hypothetical protein